VVAPECCQGPGRTVPARWGRRAGGSGATLWDQQPLLGLDQAPGPGRAAATVELVHVGDSSPAGRGTVCFQDKNNHVPFMGCGMFFTSAALQR